MAQRVKERRRHPRVRGSFGARIRTHAGEFQAEVDNVSMSGVLLLANRKIDEMAIVEMRLMLPAPHYFTFELSGAVVRCVPLAKTRAAASGHKYEIAVFFTGRPVEARAALQSFIQTQSH